MEEGELKTYVMGQTGLKQHSTMGCSITSGSITCCTITLAATVDILKCLFKKFLFYFMVFFNVVSDPKYRKHCSNQITNSLIIESQTGNEGRKLIQYQ